MSTDHDGLSPGEETFADVLNAVSLTGRKGKPRPQEQQARPERQVSRRVPQADDLPEENAASVRAYAWTGGRTRSDLKLEIETLVSTSERAEYLIDTLRTDHQQVARLCLHSKSVAEVGALLSLPLGVVRVLLSDMAGLGLIDIHRNQTANGEPPDMELLERVLRGLTNLRKTPVSPPLS